MFDVIVVDRTGASICAKCNTVVGCTRPITDENHAVLRVQLFENKELLDPDKLRVWMKHAMENQRCIWGVHKSISKAEAFKFREWFDRYENRGFHPYDSDTLMLMVRDLLRLQYEIAYDMQQHKDEYTIEDINRQVLIVMGLEKYFTELTGEVFVFEVPCTRDVDQCNRKRIADGCNHTHPLELEPPRVNYDNYTEAIALRKQCIALGLDPCTGIQRDVKKRCEIYRARIAEHMKRVQLSEEAKKRNEERMRNRGANQAKIKQFASGALKQQVLNAAAENNVDQVVALVRRGAPTGAETVRGMTPFLCLIVTGAMPSLIEEVIKLGADVNAPNKHGFTPLILACRMRDVKLIHSLMRADALEIQTGGRVGNGRTPLHWCAVHNCEEEAKVITDYVRDGGDDALRIVRFLDFQDNDGNSPLMLAAKLRNGLMCRLFLSLGANPNVRNPQRRNAAYIARDAGWTEIADWLDTKVGAGVAQIETFTDIQFEKTQRFGSLTVREALKSFGKTFLGLFQERTTVNFLGCPSVAKHEIATKGIEAEKEQDELVNKYFYTFLEKREHVRPKTSVPEVQQLQAKVEAILQVMRLGQAYPNTEAEKPLQWTALMCAVAVNDIRSMRLLIREGASVDYPNRYGTTALMLAAQLNNLDAVVELLMQGADVELCDNEGYNALAYASSLPLARPLKKSCANLLLDGDNEPARRMTTADALKLCHLYEPSLIKKLVAENAAEIAVDELRRQNHVRHLLEEYGLSKVESTLQVLKEVKSIQWRLSKQTSDVPEKSHVDISPSISEDENETEEERVERELLEKEYAAITPVGHDVEVIRCPLCTLKPPCAHFMSAETAKEYIDKDIGTRRKSRNRRRPSQSKYQKKIMQELREKVLNEANINNRDSNRSLNYINNYGSWRYKFGHVAFKSTKAIEGIKAPSNEDVGVVIRDEVRLTISQLIADVVERDKMPVEITPVSTALPIPKPLKSALKRAKLKKEKRRVRFDLPDLPPDENNVGDIHTETSAVPNSTLASDAAEADKVLSVTNNASVDSSTSISGPAGMAPAPNVSTNITCPPSQPAPFVPTTNNADAQLSISDEAPTRLLREGYLSPAQRKVAVDSLFEGGIVPENEKHLLMKIGKNPVNVQKRGVFMFTHNSFNRNGKLNGLESVAPTVSTVESLVLKGTLEEKQYRDSLQDKVPIPADVELSGWVFLGVTPLSVNHNRPVERVNINSMLWGACLDQLNDLFRVEILPIMKLHSLVHPRTWEIHSTRCSACDVGFVRCSAVTETIKDIVGSAKLCVACISRKYLYEKVLLTFPRSLRQHLVKAWPVDNAVWNTETFEDDLAAVGGVGTGENLSGMDCSDINFDVAKLRRAQSSASNSYVGLDLTIPERKQSFLERTLSKSKTFAKSRTLSNMSTASPTPATPAATKPDEIAPTQEVSPLRKMTSSMRRTSSFSNELKSQLTMNFALKSDDKSDSNSSWHRGVHDNHSQATIDTVSTDPDTDVVKHGPRELELIPLLIAKGHYEEAERSIRIALSLPAYGGDEGILHTVKLIELQAEMYKLMGLWVIALALLLDAADWLFTRLGYDDNLCYHAIDAITACLRHMGYHKEAKKYVLSTCDAIDKHSNSRQSVITATIMKKYRYLTSAHYPLL